MQFFRDSEGLPELHELVASEVPVRTGAQVFRRDAGILHPSESQDLKACRITESPYLPVPSLTQPNLDPRLVALDSKEAHLRGASRPAIDHDGLPEAGKVRLSEDALDLGNVNLFYFLPGMRKGQGKIAIVGEQ